MSTALARTQQLSMDTGEYAGFCKRYRAGRYGRVPLGKAFYDHFKLGRLPNKDDFKDLINETGAAAQRLIGQHIEFT